MSNIFISHSSENSQLVNEVFVGLIKALGYDVWTDAKSIRPSEQWLPSLVSGLEKADWFLVIVSSDAAKSEWVKCETRWANNNLKNRVIPVVVDDSDPGDIDPSLSEYQCYSYQREASPTIEPLVKLLVDAEYRGYGRDFSGE